MISLVCTSCSAESPVDSAFCRACGAAFTDTDQIAAREKLELTLSEAYRAFHDERTEEAFQMARSALKASPTSIGALSLLGMVHERRDELGEALAAYENVLSLDPDAALERLKMNEIRAKLLSAPAHRVPNQKVALAAAVLGVLVVGGLGAFAAMNTQKQGAESRSEPQQVATAFEIPQQPTSTTQQPAAQTPAAQQPGPQIQPAPVATNPAPAVRPMPALPNSGVLPVATESAPPAAAPPIYGQIGVQPEKPAPQPAPTPAAAPPKKDPDPDMSQTLPKADPKPDMGTIEISVSPNQPKVQGGGEQISSGNGLKALIETATNQYMRKDYRAAAQTYQAALGQGADPGSVNERLGRCYTYLGQKAEAKVAYERAINAYSGQSGARSQAAMEACKQALKLLQTP